VEAYVISRSEARTSYFMITKGFMPIPGIRSFVIMESHALSAVGLLVVSGN